MANCPNCGDGARWLIVSSDNDGMVCSECGTMYWPNGEFKVPRRSQPQTPLELPDGEGYWWEWCIDRGRWIAPIYMTPNAHRGPGKYIRAIEPTPPIVAKAVDADAEKIRALANYWGGKPAFRQKDFPTEADLRRIADRLEKEAKHG